MGFLFQMPECFWRVFKGKHAIDHGLEPVQGDRFIHSFKHRTASDVHTLQAELLHEHWEQGNFCASAGQNSYQTDMTVNPRGVDRARQRGRAADLDDMIHAFAAGEPERLLIPIGGCAGN